MRVTGRTAAAVVVMAALFVSAGSARSTFADDEHEEEHEDEHEDEDEDEHEDEDEDENDDENDDEDDEDDDEDEASCEDGSASGSIAAAKRSQHGARGKGRMDHDVLVRLAVRRRPRRANMRVRLRVVNQGRQRQDGVNVELFADDMTGEPIWSDVVSLPRHRKKRWRLRIPHASVAGELIAAVTLGGGTPDEDPGDNVDQRVLAGGSPTDDRDRGATLYRDLCSGCHGADGKGSAITDDDISREPWCEIYEAVSEGEDGMPAFPDLTRQDARDIADFLRHPDTQPPTEPPPTEPPPTDPPPTDPPPGGTTPTYTADVKPILDAACVSCHGASQAFGGIRLDGYANASANAARTVNSVQAGRMPPAGPLPSAQVKTLADWLSGGAPE